MKQRTVVLVTNDKAHTLCSTQAPVVKPDATYSSTLYCLTKLWEDHEPWCYVPRPSIAPLRVTKEGKTPGGPRKCNPKRLDVLIGPIDPPPRYPRMLFPYEFRNLSQRVK